MEDPNMKRVADPSAQYEATQAARRDPERESNRRKQKQEEELERLQAEHEECMKHASTHAGAIGLVYVAESNTYTKYVADIERPVVPPPPLRPDLPEPVKKQVPNTLSRGLSRFKEFLLNDSHYFLAIFPGLFIGFGLLTLTGLPYQRDTYLLVVGLLIGVAVLLGMKLLFYHMWRALGQSRTKGDLNYVVTALTGLFTAFLVAMEATLGGVALVEFSKKVSFGNTATLSPAIAIPVALAISAPIVLLSAVRGWQEGKESLEPSTRHLLAERVEETNFLALQSHIEDKYKVKLSDWEVERLRHEGDREKLIAAYEAQKDELEQYRKLPDYRALMQYISRINVIRKLLDEAQRKKTNDSISRGHEKASIY